MKLTTRDIDGFLKKRPVQAVVLVYGPDHGLVKKRVGVIATHVTPDLNDPFNVAMLTGDQVAQDSARLNDEAQAMSLMGGDRVVLVRGAGDNVTMAVKAYLTNPSPRSLVIIEAEDLSTKSSLRKLIESDARSVAVPCYIQDIDDIRRVIQQRLQGANLSIDLDAATRLAEGIAGDDQQVTSEIEKLLTYMGVDATGRAPKPARVTDDDVVAVAGAMGGATLDTFIDALLTGDGGRAFTLLHRLEDDGISLVGVVRALMFHARKLQSTQLRVAAGADLAEILAARDAPVFFRRKAAFTRQMKKWQGPALQTLMDDLLTCEARLKSSLEPEASVPQALLSIAKRAA